MPRRETRYTPRGSTWKTCPGCGKEPDHYYPANGVCQECAGYIEWARGERARFSRLQNMEHRTLPSSPSRIGLTFCPGSHSSRADHYMEFEAARSGVAEAVYALLEALALATGGAAEIHRDLKLGSRNYSNIPIPLNVDSTWHQNEKHRRLLIQPGHGEKIDNLSAQLNIMVKCAYEAGLLDGKSLLAQLARGDITVDKLTQADTEVAKSIQDAVERSERKRRD